MPRLGYYCRGKMLFPLCLLLVVPLYGKRFFQAGKTEPDWAPHPDSGFHRHGLKYQEAISDNMWIAFEADEQVNLLTIAMTAPTNDGWLGFGPSEVGSMIGGNMCVVLEEAGEMHAYAYHSRSFSTPQLNQDQNCRLLDYGRLGNESWAIFSRPLLGCRPEDIDIIPGFEKRYIAAFGSSARFSYHGETQRTTYPMDVFAGPPPDVYDMLPEDAIVMDVMTNDDVMPPQRNNYICRGFELPHDQRYHLLAYEPILPDLSPPGNYNDYHHNNLFTCIDMPEEYKDGQNHPCIYGCNVLFWIGWAVGQRIVESIDHPLPFGLGDDVPRYVVMQTHMDNPSETSYPIKGWGLKLHYVPAAQTPPNTEETAIFGHMVYLPFQGIAPGQPEYELVAECSSACTSVLPETGIWIDSWNPHFHGLGIKMVTTVLRRERLEWKEVGEIGRVNQWDADWQGPHFRRGSMFHLLPGDRLVTRCFYDTTSRTEPVFYGEGYLDEMCISFFSYHPMVDLPICGSLGIDNPTDLHLTGCIQRQSPFLDLHLNQSWIPAPEEGRRKEEGEAEGEGKGKGKGE
eukprot:Lithocolla_globosa_v1_NODE_242_length_4902_cov_29.482773.p2 type:complete len:568 gc:universal NODE_242_length_4902_cov_29.482773:4760-3057(-)